MFIMTKSDRAKNKTTKLADCSNEFSWMQHRERERKHEKELKDMEESKKVYNQLVMPKEKREGKRKKAVSGGEVSFSNP